MDLEEKYLLQERQPDYEKAELDLLKDALERNSSQRFDTLMRLIKLGFMLKNAKISHQLSDKVK